MSEGTPNTTASSSTSAASTGGGGAGAAPNSSNRTNNNRTAASNSGGRRGGRGSGRGRSGSGSGRGRGGRTNHDGANQNITNNNAEQTTTSTDYSNSRAASLLDGSNYNTNNNNNNTTAKININNGERRGRGRGRSNANTRNHRGGRGRPQQHPSPSPDRNSTAADTTTTTTPRANGSSTDAAASSSNHTHFNRNSSNSNNSKNRAPIPTQRDSAGRRGRGRGRGGVTPHTPVDANNTHSILASSMDEEGAAAGLSAQQQPEPLNNNNNKPSLHSAAPPPSTGGGGLLLANGTTHSTGPPPTSKQQQQQQQHHLSLPTPPPAGSVLKTTGIPMILSRQSHPPPTTATTTSSVQEDYEAHAQRLSERLAEAALLEDDDDVNNNVNGINHNNNTTVPPLEDASVQSTVLSEEPSTTTAAAAKSKAPTTAKKKKRAKPKKDDTGSAAPGTAAAVPEPEKVEPPVSTTQALEALPAQEVSITESTLVKIIPRNCSSASLSNNPDNAFASKISPDKKSSSKGHASNKKGGGGVANNDAKSNRSAARRFNNEVRSCVENSDPDSMRAILHDKHNHKFALDPHVLETVMKAYVMAAMFEDALYCLRNCTLPATLETSQTERILTCMPQNLRSSNAYTAADMINILCITTKFDTPTARTYFLRVVRGIALEFLEEATSARDRICSSPCERLVRAGTCVVDARLNRGKKQSDLIVLPGDQLGVWQSDAMENRGIQAGDAVSILPYAGPYPMSAESLDRNMIEATITNTNPMVLRLQDKANANLYAMLTENIDGNVFRIDKLANRMGFNRQLSAAVAIASPIGDTTSATYVRDVRRPCPQLIKAVTAMDENIDQVMKVAASATKRHASTITSTAALCGEPIPWSIADENETMDQDTIRNVSRLALEKYGALEGLNESQQLAVEGATTNRLTLVQGPPGTGKTRIAIRILEHWARLATAAAEMGADPTPILATSDSNIAVDNLVEGCAAVGLRVVRLGRPEAIRPELLRFCIDRPPSSYDANRAGANNTSGGPASPFPGGVSNNAYKDRMKQLKSAQIVCCTCIGSGGDILDSLGPLERILVDEATQATEPAVLVPLMRGCRQLVLVGDHCQLPPTVLSTRAEEEGHGVPLFSRMVACGVPPYMLDTQYRMHPGIAMFPSDLFYGGLLRNGVSAPERRPLLGFPWPREEFPIAYIPVKGVEMDDGVSKFNEAEAEAACEAVRMLLQGGQCSVSDIAVVTPYAAQARLIRRMTRRMTNIPGPPFIEVSSVDGFQGREKEAVVFSAVRSNDYGAIGFTSDWRRINVSFTRARRALIVIGNDQTLRRGDPDTWMPWLAWADAHGVNMDKPGIARGRYEPEQLRRVRGGTTAAEMLKDVLARQQAQLKQAEHQQERAVKNSAGHILGGTGDDDDEGGAATPKGLTVEEDLARSENADGNWDDSDDEDIVKKINHSGSKVTLASAASSNDLRSGDESSAVDVWDL